MDGCKHQHTHKVEEPEYWMGKVETEAGVYCDDCGKYLGPLEEVE